MRITYDQSVDAAYIYLEPNMSAGQVAKTVPVDPSAIEGGEINLDFDSEDRLIGIEILDAHRRVPIELLRDAL